MARPLDIINAVHGAFRTDMAAIDTAALRTAQGEPGLDGIVGRFWRMDEVLVWHAEGEEKSIFPPLERVAPDVITAYEMDHRGLDIAFDALRSAVSERDPIETARATAAFKFHLDLHLLKEDRHLYVLFVERLSDEEQAGAVAGLASGVPDGRFGDFIAWLFPLLGDQDRENVLTYWRSAMPPDVFPGVHQLAEAAIAGASPEGSTST